MARPRFTPNEAQREIAAAFSDNAAMLGARETLHALLIEAGARFDEPRIGELVVHVGARQAEFGAAVVTEFAHGRFSVATVLVRSMLETAARIAWPLGHDDDQEQRERLVRLLLVGYRDALNKGHAIPPDATALLAGVSGKAAKRPPSFEDMLRQLDELEASSPQGKPFWVSHAKHYDFASDYTHPTFAATIGSVEDPTPLEWLGVSALTWGHQYLALAGSSCAILAELPDLQRQIEKRYADVAELQQAERMRVMGA